MKGRHQFRRRFSLQPSFLKEEPEDDRHHHNNRTTGEREEGEELLPEREAVTCTGPNEADRAGEYGEKEVDKSLLGVTRIQLNIPKNGRPHP
uniref:Uncharacterized protein n=1 Tax=Timema bartmani TaxID=61472 RepID=A0A7R9I4G7_9NEOP|nr:unnamed protein product [Timema bartmani]